MNAASTESDQHMPAASGLAAGFWNVPLAGVLTDLAASPAGLSSEEARSRVGVYGANAPATQKPQPAIVQLLLRLSNPLILLLLMASALSAAAGDVSSFVIVAVIVVVSVLLDFVQERHAEHTMEELARSVAVTAAVLRDGKVEERPVATLVPGDVIALGPGDLVPADCRLIEARDLTVNEALLTGEAYPVEKHAGDLPGNAMAATAATNAVFQATSIMTGSGRAVVCVTGAATRLGHIATALRSRPPASSFALSVNRFGMLMLRITVFIVLFVLAANVFFGRPLLQSLMFALALAVALTPELLPAIIAVTLARGARRLADRKVVVKQLAAIHNLGAMDVLCTDKTGTLTEARIEVARSVDGSGGDSDRAVLLGFLNSHFSNGVLSALDQAIIAHGGDVNGWTKVDEVPFDYQRRRISLLLENAGRRILVTKGAPESVLAQCREYEAKGERQSLAAPARAAIDRTFGELSAAGLRLLAVAWRDEPADKAVVGVADEAGLVLAGFIAFRDPPKATAGETVGALKRLGVDLKILTGDTELVTRHLCEEIGIPVTGLLNGDALDQLSEAALMARLDGTNVFCRMAPADKERVIALVRRRGHTVGYLGDGVNDAPALHAADIGISVDGAADVAREAASLILLEHDLSVVLDGVVEGRRAVENAVKYLLMGTSSNFGNMVSMAGAALVLPILPMLPIQVLLNNLLYDTSELGIPFDDVDAETLQRPVRWDLGMIRRVMLILGPVSSVFDFLTFFVLLAVFHAGAAEFQTGWFVESLATQALVVFAIRSRRLFFRSRPNPVLATLTIAVVALAAILPITPAGPWFGLIPLPPLYYGFVAVATAAYLALVELIKPVVLRAPGSRSSA
ncbi:MAG TPA: magnesium-translocating P-type ATPase [Bauldia sp.]|nr:magnesium-translocating P-type ATPase [Bauldia sp.]